MLWHVDPGSELPIYRQLMRIVSGAIAGGTLVAGDRLPSYRELAQQLVIAPLTVKKAFDELERAGLIVTQHGRGCFVAARAAEDRVERRIERLRDPARRLATEARLAGVSTADLVRLVREEAAELDREKKRQGERHDSARTR